MRGKRHRLEPGYCTLKCKNVFSPYRALPGEFVRSKSRSAYFFAETALRMQGVPVALERRE